MLKKYTLVNVPEGGVDHLVDGRRWHISDALTDDQADMLIQAGLGHYFQPKPQTNVTPTQARRGKNGRFATVPTQPADAPAIDAGTDGADAGTDTGGTDATQPGADEPAGTAIDAGTDDEPGTAANVTQ